MNLRKVSLIIVVFWFSLSLSAIAAAQISEDAAIQALMTWIQSHNYYDLPARCIKPKSLGCKNEGYAIELFVGNCAGYTQDSLLGRWRVDVHTAEVYVQNKTGKYLSPNFSGGKDTTSLVREERKIVINGIEEHWRLEWLGKPSPACGPEDEDWTTCPCTGFAFGEQGNLDLVRKRPGQKDERFSLTPLFDNDFDRPLSTREAVLRRWDVADNDIKASDSPRFVDQVRSRPTAEIMQFADYDHDGRASEFILQIGTDPCGKRMCVVVGVSANNDHLHVFSSRKNPKEPLILQAHQWASLSRASGPIKVIGLACGDHGSDAEIELELRAENGTIYTRWKEYQCTENGKRGRVINEGEY
jgi:hypothetical protein